MKKENKPFLSIGMIVKDEEEMIREALESIKEADEIVVIDTGSTDSTIEICKEYTDKVYTDYKWNDNFAEAKNLTLSRLTGTWQMMLDADCRVEPGGIEKIRKMCKEAPADAPILNVRLVANDLKNKDRLFHRLPKLFRAGNGVQYIGRVHESVNKQGIGDGEVTIVYLYSPNHHKDPDRNIRILLKEEDQSKPRTLFYLGREYFERKRYEEAIEVFTKYVQVGSWSPELAEANLCLARCYWFTQRGNEAREACLQAIKCNPDFKEALRMMALMHYEPWKSKWLKIADNATNKDVLFVRT
jgi:glycosyltransferase involved in cell wall biosynthesis